MNESLLANVDITISEGLSQAVVELGKTCKEYKEFMKDMLRKSDEIAEILSPENKSLFEHYNKMVENRVYFELRYIYIRGFKDFCEVAKYLDSEGLDKCSLNFELEN